MILKEELEREGEKEYISEERGRKVRRRKPHYLNLPKEGTTYEYTCTHRI